MITSISDYLLLAGSLSLSTCFALRLIIAILLHYQCCLFKVVIARCLDRLSTIERFASRVISNVLFIAQRNQVLCGVL